MSISKASRVTEAERHFVIAIDDVKAGKIFGVVHHMTYPQALYFAGLMELVWIIETVSDELCCPVSLTKERSFHKLLPNPRELNKSRGVCKVRYGKLATLKIRLKHRNNASWQGIVAWVENEETKKFDSFLDLARFIGQIAAPKEKRYVGKSCTMACCISIENQDPDCMRGRISSLNKLQSTSFCGVLELVKSADFIMANWSREEQSTSPLMMKWVGNDYMAGRVANFIVHVKFCEHATWQGTVCWQERKQTINFRSFLELVKLMNLAVFNIKLQKTNEAEIRTEKR